jgi:WhiB family redox-sensing transcriptional regulator
MNERPYENSAYRVEAGEALNPGWQAEAACRGMDQRPFFIERGERGSTAKAVCRVCPVRSECLEYALVAGEKFGVWGGLTEQERKRVRGQRWRAA